MSDPPTKTKRTLSEEVRRELAEIEAAADRGEIGEELDIDADNGHVPPPSGRSEPTPQGPRSRKH